MTEDDLLGWFRSLPGTELLGDDGAVLPPVPGPTVATVDSQIEGVHFPAGLDPALVARRLLAVNLSDLAAMGARPHTALLALSGPPAADRLDRRRFLAALLDACAGYGVTLAGGDLASAPVTVATLTLLGSIPSGRAPLRRSTARAGQALWVGGSLGEAALGLALLERGEATEPVAERAVHRWTTPEPQLELGAWLSEHRSETSAVMDLSDGLARDLPRLARESAVGARVELGALAPSSDVEALCRRLDLSALDLALGGGEDYVLLFTLDDGDRPPERFSGARRIGRITALGEPGDGLRLAGANGDERPWPHGSGAGWDHLAG